MSYRETHTSYHSGTQQQHKLQLITFLGWTLGRQRKYNANALFPQLSPLEIPEKQGGVMWYTMYGKDTPLPLPFLTDKKKVYQHKYFTPLQNLQPHHHYAVWCLNAKYESENTGEWFWADAIEILPSQAKELLTFKKRHVDIDHPHPKKKVMAVMEWGYPEGAQIYDYAVDFYGNDTLSKSQWMMVVEAYYKDIDDAKARDFKEQLAKERLFESLFGEKK